LAKKILNKKTRLSLQQASVLFFVSLALVLFLALFSYHPDDPGFFSRNNIFTGDIHNKVGTQGAWIADLLFGVFGSVAFLIPAGLIPLGFLTFRLLPPPNPANPRGGVNTVIVVFGVILALLSLTSLSHMLIPSSLPHGAGGSLGRSLVGLSARSFLGYQGSVLVMFSGFLIGITLAFNIRWGIVTEKVGDFTLSLFDNAQEKLNDQEAETLPQKLKQLLFGTPMSVVEKLRDTATGVLKVNDKDQKGSNEPNLQLPPNLDKDILLEQKEKSDSARIATERLKNTEVTVTSKNGHNVNLPPLSLLNPAIEPYAEDSEAAKQQKEVINALEAKIPSILENFGIKDSVVTATHSGPVVTRFEIQLSVSTKVNQVSNLAKDLARNLGVSSVRVVEVIPGKTTIGLEVPNEQRDIVAISEVLSSPLYQNNISPLTLVLGKDISGKAMICDLDRMPHILMSGTLGSGKSVAINTMLMSLLYKSSPEQVRLLLIDPKMLELNIYADIPHLLTPVITDMDEATNSLAWCITEMERRYVLMSKLKVRNIAGYNEKIQFALNTDNPLLDESYTQQAEEQTENLLKILPHIVVVIDEFADMMMVIGQNLENLIAKIAQKARAAGIHLIIATQRSSTDVITDLIKANIPSRIAFQTASKMDSRTILDQGGAENLLGKGDMLYLPPGTAIPQRIHGALVSEEEINAVVEFIRSESESEPDYVDEVIAKTEFDAILGQEKINKSTTTDPLYEEAISVVTESGRASISYLQRRLKVGYNRAASMMSDMETAGVVTEVQSNGTRAVIATSSSES
jgi:S-DNA-T family DNA segregation ATPase FtsK/SpoIIIE